MPPQHKLSTVTLDGTHASLSPNVETRPPETAQVLLEPDEPFKLHVFIDHSIVEVFVNGRQCLAIRVHPTRNDSLGVSLRAQGQSAELRSLDAWNMNAIQP
jgi:beta-fructofuranosidase